MRKLNSKGFTIVELMISTAVFSTVLVGCAAALITVGRQLRKTDITITTQNSARAIIEEISRQVQLSTKAPVFNGNSICVGSIRYVFALDTQVETNPSGPNQGRHALWRDILPGSGTCPATALNVPTPTGGLPNSGQELLPLHARLTSFSINNGTPTYISTNNRLWDIDLAVLYGENSVIIDPILNKKCRQTSVGGALCALSQLHTTVFRRVQ